ncbi:DNA polymerase III gamma/tau subunit [Rhizobium sp. AN70]|nr:DNA polymerase III gamma/tau subunit [Rhizobium sp. AN70]
MQQVSASRWRGKGWAVPVSVLLHLAVVAIFLFELPERIAEPQEPESISVDLVPPPEEKKAEEQKPPAAEQAKEEKPQPPPPPPAPPAEEAKPSPPMQATLPAIAMRPEETQADPEDKPGKVEEAEKTEPSKEPESQPEKTVEDKPAPAAANSDLKASAEQGEIAVSPVKQEVEPEKAPVPQVKPAEEKPAEEAKEKPAKLPAAKNLLSSTVLSPAQRRQMFGDLPPRRRIVQLCSTEALAQIQGAGFAARGMIPYSDTGGRISGNSIDASGGAFNTGDSWHDVSFQCEVDLENYTVTEFRFKIGNAISPEEAKKRGFTRFQ